jgi:hypothetical protein
MYITIYSQQKMHLQIGFQFTNPAKKNTRPLFHLNHEGPTRDSDLYFYAGD